MHSRSRAGGVADATTSKPKGDSINKASRQRVGNQRVRRRRDDVNA
jgi:hypothetical protein